jgi:hypothetical protein
MSGIFRALRREFEPRPKTDRLPRKLDRSSNQGGDRFSGNGIVSCKGSERSLEPGTMVDRAENFRT